MIDPGDYDTPEGYWYAHCEALAAAVEALLEGVSPGSSLIFDSATDALNDWVRARG